MEIQNKAEFFREFAEKRVSEIIQKEIELRNESYLSQAQVGDILGLKSSSGIAAIEKGKTSPGLDRILRILAVYGYTLDVVPVNAP